MTPVFHPFQLHEVSTGFGQIGPCNMDGNGPELDLHSDADGIVIACDGEVITKSAAFIVATSNFRLCREARAKAIAMLAETLSRKDA